MEFFNTREVKAVRKARPCDECGHMIEVGQAATDYAQMFEGDFYSGSTHPDCVAWASKVIPSEWGEGRPFVRDCDPAEVDFNDKWLMANPTPSEVYDRLPPSWQAVVDDAREAARQTVLQFPTPTQKEAGDE